MVRDGTMNEKEAGAGSSTIARPAGALTAVPGLLV